jgi:hypothetical protein
MNSRSPGTRQPYRDKTSKALDPRFPPTRCGRLTRPKIGPGRSGAQVKEETMRAGHRRRSMQRGFESSARDRSGHTTGNEKKWPAFDATVQG